ncbi:MAG: hypothetical protein M3Y69_04250, partial [Verrucomicrobiota bacterium]|nr:hypothetical protein [Verrucomicrobiota bacterium]
PRGMAMDAQGNLFVADTYSNTVRKITPDAVVTTVAGIPPGVAGYADFVGPKALALDRAGNLLVVDSDRIRKIRSDGVVVTIGGGTPPYTGGWNDGIGSSARFFGPRGVVVGADGFIYVADSGNNTIRRGGPNAVSQLVNLSARAKLRTADDVLIGGFIVRGEATRFSDGGFARLSLRALGPSLGAAGITDALRDPTLELRNPDGKLVAANDNWRENSLNGQAILEQGLPPSDDAESAIVSYLKNSATAVLRAADGGSGVAVVEIYQREDGAPVELVNISARGFVGVGDEVLIAGFFMGGGSGTGRVLLRALGPSLAEAGVNSALADPVLSLHDANGAALAANNDWKDSEKEAIESTGIPPSNDRDSALLAILPRGPYTAIVKGRDGTTGVATVEVYKMPDELR